MLGSAQRRWLFDALRKSKATFRIIASPVPWASGARAGEDDWDGYHQGYDELQMHLSFLLSFYLH